MNRWSSYFLNILRIVAASVYGVSRHATMPDLENPLSLDMAGKTVIPGLVGMHEHLFYPTPQQSQGGVAFYGGLTKAKRATPETSEAVRAGDSALPLDQHVNE